MSGSVQATDRLMKELRDIYRSQSFKGGESAPGGARAHASHRGGHGRGQAPSSFGTYELVRPGGGFPGPVA